MLLFHYLHTDVCERGLQLLEDAQGLLEEAQGLLEEFTELYSTSLEADLLEEFTELYSTSLEADLLEDSVIMDEAQQNSLEGASTLTSAEAETEPEYGCVAPCHSSGRETVEEVWLQEELSVDPDDIDPVIKPRDYHSESHDPLTVPRPPNDIDILDGIEEDEDEEFEDALYDFPEDDTIPSHHRASEVTSPDHSGLYQTTNSTRSHSTTSSMISEEHSMMVSVPSGPTGAGALATTEDMDGGRVGDLLRDCQPAGARKKGKQKMKKEEEEIENSLKEFDSFMEEVPDEFFAKVLYTT